MKTQMTLSSFVICLVSLSVGCARVNEPAGKKPAPATSKTEISDVAPTQEQVDNLIKTISSPAGSITLQNIAAGSLDAVIAGSLSADGLSAGSLSDDPSAAAAEPPALMEPLPAATGTGEITSAKILDFAKRLEIPLVLPFSMPGHDAKDEVQHLVGMACDREVAKAKSVKGQTNLARLLTADLCYTNILRRGSPKVVVVPGVLITRHTKIGEVDRMYEVVLRNDSSVSAIRETIKDGKNVPEVRTAIVNARNAVIASVVTAKESKMVFDWNNGVVRYEASSTVANGKVMTASKKLFARNYSGMNLTVTEDSPTSNPEDTTCNVIAIKPSTLDISLSETLKGRCFHRN